LLRLVRASEGISDALVTGASAEALASPEWVVESSEEVDDELEQADMLRMATQAATASAGRAMRDMILLRVVGK
jgi:hypothetical protein